MKLLPRVVAAYAVASWVVALAVSPLQHQAVQLSPPDTHSITLLGEEPSTVLSRHTAQVHTELIPILIAGRESRGHQNSRRLQGVSHRHGQG